MMLEVLIVNLSLQLFKQLGYQNIVEIADSQGNERCKSLTSLSSHVIVLGFFLVKLEVIRRKYYVILVRKLNKK